MGETYNYLVHTNYLWKPQLTECPEYKESLPLHIEDFSQIGKAPFALLAWGELFPKWQRFAYKTLTCFLLKHTSLSLVWGCLKGRSELTFIDHLLLSQA